MTKTDILELLTRDFFENFAQQCAEIIRREGAEEVLFQLLKDITSRDRDVLKELNLTTSAAINRAEFRSAYVFEQIYFYNPTILEVRAKEFIEMFPNINGESAKRHFCKIMSHFLTIIRWRNYHNELEAVAGSCVEWIMNQKVRVAVVVWAVETLLILRDSYEWLPEIVDEILEKLSEKPTAGMKVRLKKWKFELQ